MQKREITHDKQKGVAALLIAVVLLLMSTLVVLYAGRVGLMDQRMSGNDSRAKEAFGNAEAGREEMEAIVKKAHENLTYPVTLSDVNYTASAFTIPNAIQIVGRGTTLDGTGAAAVSQLYGIADIFRAGPDAPMVVGGTVPPTGAMEIVGNPNGGGPGVLVSVWSGSDVDFSDASSGTCHLSEYLGNGSLTPTGTSEIQPCAANACTCNGTIDGRVSGFWDKDGVGGPESVEGSDIVQNDPNFPTDLFAYTFGYPWTDWETFKEILSDTLYPGLKEITSCSGLDANSSGIYWVSDGNNGPADCNISQAQVGGNKTCTYNGKTNQLCAVVLIVDKGDFKMTGGGGKQLYGLVFMFNHDDKDNVGEAHMSGSSAIIGAFVTSGTLAGWSVAGSFDVRYDRNVFEAITGGGTTIKELSRVAGSWNDLE